MKDQLVAAFETAIAACDPGARVAGAQATIGIAVGKAALAMARGARVERGIIVTPVEGDVPGWQTIVSAHPHPDDRSILAGRALRVLIDSATPDDTVLALISGGSSALIEDPRIPLDEFVATVRAVMATGASIYELNLVRTALSAIKGGKLVEACRAPVTTLVASDITNDAVATVGSGPTIGPWIEQPAVDAGAHEDAVRRGAMAVLAKYGVPAPAILQAPIESRLVTRTDRVQLVLPMRAFADELGKILAMRVLETPMSVGVSHVAKDLESRAPCIAWGEPTLHVPKQHGEGGRAQQLALELAWLLRGTKRWAFVAGTDGIDGPLPERRPTPAGAFVDGKTWDKIVAVGIDPHRALGKCDAGTALAAVGALVVTGPTGVNHADIAIVV
jgi:glycerate-2-kinase